MSVMGFRKTALVTAALLAAVAASGQGNIGKNYDVKTMNFDLWCQEQAGLSPERCDKRLPDDEKTFENFRANVERYEVPYLQQKNDEISLDRNLLRNDPVDNPTNQIPNPMPATPTPSAQSGLPQQ